MPTILPINPNFDRAKTNAKIVKNILDTKTPSLIYNHSIEQIQHHLDDCNYHPTTGLLARHKYIDSVPKNFPHHFAINKSIAQKHPRIKYFHKIVEERLNTLYPKTRKIREYIIKDNRIEFDFVKRAKGYNLLDKLKIFFR